MSHSSLAQHIHSSGPSDLWSLAPHRPAPRDRFLVAVASGGGGSFEEAEAFLLYEKHGNETAFIGRQPCPLTVDGNDPARRARLLADCDLVLCAGISETCRRKLTLLGIQCDVDYTSNAISDAVSALQST